jgi:MinD-like ATPase involved in chromosome partitioning or flagellar assembly
MSIVAVCGDASTTTAVALASAWPASQDVLLVEVDPSGGDLAAWFDMPTTPSLSNVVTRVLDGAWPEVECQARVADSGLRVIPAPAGRGEAAQAVSESARSLVTTLSRLRSPAIIADTGRVQPSPVAHPFVTASAVNVLVHRQSTQSSGAAAVRLQRLADEAEVLAAEPAALIVAVIGAVPFGIGEIERFLEASMGAIAVVGLPVDELAASVLGGRTGVSSRRLSRLPLMRASRDLAAVVERALAMCPDGPRGNIR